MLGGILLAVLLDRLEIGIGILGRIDDGHNDDGRLARRHALVIGARHSGIGEEPKYRKHDEQANANGLDATPPQARQP